MPIQIDQIQTDVQLSPPGAEPAAGSSAPAWQQQEQWRRLMWQQHCDAARTSASGNDSGHDEA